MTEIFEQTILLMPFICIIIFFFAFCIQEYIARRGGNFFESTAKSGYPFTCIDDRGLIYHFRICGCFRAGYRVYLEDIPADFDKSSVREDSYGHQYLADPAQSTLEAEYNAQEFVKKRNEKI